MLIAPGYFRTPTHMHMYDTRIQNVDMTYNADGIKSTNAYTCSI